MIDTFDIVLLIEGKQLEDKFSELWNKLTDIFNRDLNLCKETNSYIERDLEMIIKRARDKIMPFRTEIEKVIDYIRKKNKKIINKFL